METPLRNSIKPKLFKTQNYWLPRWRPSYQRIKNVRSPDGKGYVPVEVEDATSKHWKYITMGGSILAGIALFLVAVAIYVLVSGESLIPQHPSHIAGPCGNSSAEARAMGCSFDQLMWAWYPKYCPHYANDRFLNAEPEQPWRFYTDPYAKIQATKDDWDKLLNNEIRVWGERREHLTHCVFMFLSVGQVVRDGTRYTPRQVDYEHLEHCAELMLEALRDDEHWYDVQTEAPLVFYNQDC